MNGKLLRNYLIFTAGLFWAALGISLITGAGLGTSPVTSLSYVMTFITPLSLGTAVFLVNGAMFLAQAAILRRRFQKIQLLQLPATFVFSAFIDLISSLLREPAAYPGRIAMLLLGCGALGLGVALEVLADVIILPGEGIVKVIAQELGKEFGNVKTVFDIALVSSAAAISWMFLGHVAGIREGTVIAALIVGTISRFFRSRLQFLTGKPIPPARAQELKREPEAAALPPQTI